MDWPEWHAQFAKLFNAGDWADDSIDLWVRTVFVPCGMTPDEVWEAAVLVAQAGPPSKPHDVLRVLIDTVREQRVAAIVARERQEREGGARLAVPDCPACGGVGLALVPRRPQSADALARGELRTCFVSCKCSAGLRLARTCRNHRDEALLTLARYEAEWPDWADDLWQYERQRVVEGRQTAATRGWDAAVKAVLKGAERRRQRR